MTSKIRLYDMDKDEWRGKFNRGDSWRSRTVHIGLICGTKINIWVMGGWPGSGPRIICPGDEYKEHDELENAVQEAEHLDRKIRDYKKNLSKAKNVNKENAKTMIKNLEAEKELLDDKIQRMRGEFAGVLDDVEGVGGDYETTGFYPYSRYCGKKRSLRGEGRLKEDSVSCSSTRLFKEGDKGG